MKYTQKFVEYVDGSKFYLHTGIKYGKYREESKNAL